MSRQIAASDIAPLLPSILPALSVPFSRGGLPKLSPALTGVRNRTSPARIAVIGDSLVAGWGTQIDTGSNSGLTPGVYYRAKSWPQQFGALLQQAGIPTRSDAIFGTGRTQTDSVAEFVAANPNVAIGTDWSIYDLGTIGGRAFTQSAGTTAWTLTPAFAADAFDLYFATLGSFGVATISDASGTLGTINTNTPAGAGSYVKLTVTRPTASKLPVSVKWTSGGPIYLTAVRPYDTGNPRAEIWNMGWGGSTTGNWTTPPGNGWLAFSALGLIDAPDMAFIELGANDANTGVAAATYQANLATIATLMKGRGCDVQMVKPHATVTPTNGFNVSAAYLAAIDTVAASVGLPALNFNALALGNVIYHYDEIHLTTNGYALEAQAALAAVMAVV